MKSVVDGGNDRDRQRTLRVLVVEDEWLIALDLADEVTAAGYEVIGPVLSVSAALELLDTVGPDAALLDVNLDGEMSYPIAEILAARSIPFIFVSGYAAGQIRADFRDIPLLGKPVQPRTLQLELDRMLQPKA